MSCSERPSQRIWKIINKLSYTICIFSKESFKTVFLENLIHGVYHLWSKRGRIKCSDFKWKEMLVAQLCLTLLQPHGLQLVRLLSVKLSRQEYWSGLLFPFQGDLPNPGSNLAFPHWRQILYCLSHQWSLEHRWQMHIKSFRRGISWPTFWPQLC